MPKKEVFRIFRVRLTLEVEFVEKYPTLEAAKKALSDLHFEISCKEHGIYDASLLRGNSLECFGVIKRLGEFNTHLISRYTIIKTDN